MPRDGSCLGSLPPRPRLLIGLGVSSSLLFLFPLLSSLPCFVSPLSSSPRSLARPLLSTRTIAMSAYPRMDPYRGSKYEHGIDAKVVVMGNSGELPSMPFLRITLPYSLPPATRCVPDQPPTTIHSK